MKKLFSTSDLCALSGEDRNSVKVQLTRLVERGVIERPVRGWYINPFTTVTPHELAMVIRRPAYISMESALSEHGVLSQRAVVLTLVTTKGPYVFATRDNEFEYHQIKKGLFFGYDPDAAVAMADPEKALLDLIYIRVIKGGSMSSEALDSLLDDMYLEDLDKKRLSEYGSKFDKRTVRVLEEKGLIG